MEGKVPESLVEPILWVCRENIGRSQVAMEFWNKNHTIPSYSAGLQAEEGRVVGDYSYAEVLIDVMLHDYHIDITQNPTTRFEKLESERLSSFGSIVLLAEPEVVPQDVRTLQNSRRWEIQDMKNVTYESTRNTVEFIRRSLAKIYVAKSNRN